VAALVLLTLGDGGGSDSSLDLYLGEVETIMNDINTQSGEVQVQTADGVLPAWASVLRDAVSRLESMEPPGKAADAHNDLKTALNDVQAGMNELFRSQANIETTDQVLALVAGDEKIQDAQRRAIDACERLQKLADENDVSVRLGLCAPASSLAESPTAAR